MDREAGSWTPRYWVCAVTGSRAESVSHGSRSPRRGGPSDRPDGGYPRRSRRHLAPWDVYVPTATGCGPSNHAQLGASS